MKKIILFSAMALISFSTMAQKKGGSMKGGGMSDMTYGVKAGVTFPTVNISPSLPAGRSESSITLFYVGGIVDVPLFSILSIQPGLFYVGKGYKTTNTLVTPNVIGNTNIWYLEIPVNLVAKKELGPGKIFVGAGPYVGYAVATNGLKIGTDIHEIDFGLDFMLGYQLDKGLGINVAYDLGLLNINKTAGSPYTLKNSVFSVGLAYSF